MDISYYQKFEPIDGRWYINKKLGSGSFGTVLELERRDLTSMKSAVKIITVPANSSEVDSYREENYDLDEKSISSYFYGFVEDFTKEIQLMSELKGHPNIVTIEDYDVKEHEGDIGWDIFIRMELLTPMNQYFKNVAPNQSNVIQLGIDICKALEECQKYQIIHRDIKPSNIFISKNNEYKLGDFGVSRTLEKTSSGLSKKGTYTYMAPEVFKGEAYGSNVDIYSLGIVMYKLLNNNMEPYKQGRTHADEENALAARLKGEPMPKPTNAEGKLAEIILKACAFEPKSRYESAKAMREDLEAVLTEQEPVVTQDYASQQPTEDVPDNLDAEETVSIFADVPDLDETVGIFSQNPTPVAKPVPEEVKVAVPKTEPVTEKPKVTIPPRPVSNRGATAPKKAPSPQATTQRRTSGAPTKQAPSKPLFSNIDEYDSELKETKATELNKGLSREDIAAAWVTILVILFLVIIFWIGLS